MEPLHTRVIKEVKFIETSFSKDFPTPTSISKIIVRKEIYHFEIDGKSASRQQFPLQNAFALTVHKTQGLTLPHITLNVDENMFAEGQVYVAMSRATSLVAVAQQLSLSVSVAIGASLVEFTLFWRGAETVTAADFQPAFVIIALISATTALMFLRLPPDAGAEVSRREITSSAGPTAASDQKQG